MSEDRLSTSDELYRRLEVATEASQDEIARSYRRLAHGTHPDAHPDDPDASRRFRELTEAYAVLSDPARRAHYDRTRHPIRERVIAPTAAWIAGDPAFLVDLGPSPAGSKYLRVGPVHVDPGSATPPHVRTNIDPTSTDPTVAARARLIMALPALWRSW
jgi:curved DNA-binding protein CbpA